jgi:hypothetical protein
MLFAFVAGEEGEQEGWRGERGNGLVPVLFGGKKECKIFQVNGYGLPKCTG